MFGGLAIDGSVSV